MIYRVLYIPGGAGFRPPTIGMDVDIDRNSVISQRSFRDFRPVSFGGVGENHLVIG